MKLSVRRRNVLLDYDRPETGRAPSTRDWTRREQNWALENGFISVGPEVGAHILTPLGRKALADDVPCDER